MSGKILIIEDEPAICEMVGFALSRAGYHYQMATDAVQAHKIILEALPDLILAELLLGGRIGA